MSKNISSANIINSNTSKQALAEKATTYKEIIRLQESSYWEKEEGVFERARGPNEHVKMVRDGLHVEL